MPEKVLNIVSFSRSFCLQYKSVVGIRLNYIQSRKIRKCDHYNNCYIHNINLLMACFSLCYELFKKESGERATGGVTITVNIAASLSAVNFLASSEFVIFFEVTTFYRHLIKKLVSGNIIF